MTAKASFAATSDLQLLQLLADRVGPISDAQAERSLALVNRARDNIYGSFGRTADAAHLEIAHALLLEALELDPRNHLGILFLITFGREDVNRCGTILENVAKSLMDPTPIPRPGAHALWSIGSEDQSDHMAAVAICAGLLDDAGRYGCANALRIKGLKLDTRDGMGLRYYVVAHALMIGDLRTVNKWLKWAKKERQTRRFWAWAETLALRLAGAPADTGAPVFDEALRLEPQVPKFIVRNLDSARELSEMAIAVGSQMEQRHHAAILRRAWAAHPEHCNWLVLNLEDSKQDW